MNWKTEAVDRLQRYNALQQALLTMPKELKRLALEADALRDSRKNTRQGQNMLLDNLVMQQQLQRALEQAELFVSVTDQALNALKPEEIQLLKRLVMDSQWGNGNELLIDLGVARSTLYKKRDKALRKFALALYGNS